MQNRNTYILNEYVEVKKLKAPQRALNLLCSQILKPNEPNRFHGRWRTLLYKLILLDGPFYS